MESETAMNKICVAVPEKEKISLRGERFFVVHGF